MSTNRQQVHLVHPLQSRWAPPGRGQRIRGVECDKALDKTHSPPAETWACVFSILERARAKECRATAIFSLDAVTPLLLGSRLQHPHPTRQMVAFYWASGLDTQLISLCILTTCQLKWQAKAFGKKGMERKKSFKFRAKWCEAFPAWQEKCVYLVLKGIGPAVRETMTMTLSTVSPLEQKY